MVCILAALIFTLRSSVLAGYQGYSPRPNPFYSPQTTEERQNIQHNSHPISPQAQKLSQIPPQLQQHQIDPKRQQQYQVNPQRQQQYQINPQVQQQYQINPQRNQQYQVNPQIQQQYQLNPQLQQQYQIDTQRQQKYQINPQVQQQYQIDPRRQQQYQDDLQRPPQYQIDPQIQQQYQVDPRKQQQYQAKPQIQQQYQVDPQIQQQFQIEPRAQQQYQRKLFNLNPQYQNKTPQYPSQYQNEISPYVSTYQQQNQPPHHVDAASQMIEAPESPTSKKVLSTTNDMFQSVPIPHLKYDQNENPILEFGSNNGFQKNRGDKAARRGEFPYHVQIREHGKFICCGTLVKSPITGKHVVITATHCLVERGTSKLASPKNYEVRVDILDREDFGQRRKLKQFLVHPGYVVSSYRTRPLYNDIGMMILEADFEENQFVIPLALPTTYGPTIWNYVTVTGWGKGRESGHSGLSNVLRVVEMGVWDSEDCDRIYFSESGQHVVTDAQFCAGTIEGGLDACQAWGKGCGQGQYPGLYTRVWSYKDWIKKTLYDYEINGIVPPPPTYPQ